MLSECCWNNENKSYNTNTWITKGLRNGTRRSHNVDTSLLFCFSGCCDHRREKQPLSPHCLIILHVSSFAVNVLFLFLFFSKSEFEWTDGWLQPGNTNKQLYWPSSALYIKPWTVHYLLCVCVCVCVCVSLEMDYAKDVFRTYSKLPVCVKLGHKRLQPRMFLPLKVMLDEQHLTQRLLLNILIKH